MWLKKYTVSLVATILFIVLLVVAYPFYQYYIDPDATAYLTIAKRYVAGDYHRAINGYWSPWGIWFTALLTGAGIAEFKAAIAVNAAGAIGFLFISQSLFLLFRLQRLMQWALNGALVVFLVYAVFWQSFDDLWECFFLLCILRVMLAERFTSNFLLWVAIGFLGALAYFAKAYSFPFFMLEVVVCSYILTGSKQKINRLKWFKIVTTSIVCLFVFSSPWICLLYNKYGTWMTGTAGKLNTSWYLVGHPYWKADIKHLLPPVYADSPSYWEDPFYANGNTPHLWSSGKLFLLQIIRVGYNLIKLVQSINELSCFFALAFIGALSVTVSKKLNEQAERSFVVLCTSFLLFPLGYLLVNYQSRYLWYMLPLGMIIIATGFQKIALQEKVGPHLKTAITVVFAFSFVAFPILGLKEMYKSGEQQYSMAKVLRESGIKGDFTTNIPYGGETQNIVRLSYFSGNPYYNVPLPTPIDELLQEMRRYHVRYYYHFYEHEADNFQLLDEQGRPYKEVTQGKVTGLKVFLVGN